MLGASKGLAGNHGDLELLQQKVCEVGGSGDRSVWAVLSEQFTHIGEGIKCSGGHSAVDAGHRIQPLEHDLPSPIELCHHCLRKGAAFTQRDDGSLL